MMRCLALADELRRRDVEAAFLCIDMPGNLSWLARSAGYQVEWVDTGRRGSDAERRDADAKACSAVAGLGNDDWLVVDHYGLDQRWETAMRSRFRRILAIDDLADRSHDCDVLLDQNRIGERTKDYANLVTPACKVLAGPGFALLSRQYSEWRGKQALREGRLRRILVFFGSADEENHTRTALEGIALWGRAVNVTVVAGAANPNRQRIEAQCLGMASAQLHVQTTEMARLIVEADCAIGAAGSSTWERCCLGLPSLLAVCAVNQEIVAETAAAQGVAHNMGLARELTPESYAEQLECLSATVLKDMEARARVLVDGKGAMRLAEELLR